MKTKATVILGRMTMVAAVALTAAILTASSAKAANHTWDGGGGTDAWSEDANWTTSAPNSADDYLYFAGTTRLTPSNDMAGQDWKRISFSVGAGAFVLGGGDLGKLTDVHAIIDYETTATQTVDMAFQLDNGGDQYIWVYDGGRLVLNGDISGSSRLVKNQTFDGVLELNGDLSLDGGIYFKTYVSDPGNELVLAGDNSGMAGGVSVYSSANAVLRIESPTALGQGTFAVGSNSFGAIFDNTSGGPLTLTTDNLISVVGALRFNGTDDLHLGNGDVTGHGTVVVGANTLTLGGSIQTNGLYKSGPGTLAVTGTSATTNLTRIYDGILRADEGVGLNSGQGLYISDNNLSISSSPILETGVDFTRSCGWNAGADQCHVTGEPGDTVGFSARGGPVVVSMGGLATPQTLTFYNRYTGFGGGMELMLNAASANDTLEFRNPLNLTSGDWTVRVDADPAYPATMSGALERSGGSAGGLIKNGPGTLILSGANTYDGPTTVAEGTLAIDAGSSTGTGPVIVTGGTFLLNAGASAGTGSVTVETGGTLAGAGTVAGPAVISGTHNPGNTPGVQPFASDLTYNSGATVNWELTKSSTVQESPTAIFDQGTVAGDLDFAGDTTLNLIFADTPGSDSTVLWADDFWNHQHKETDGWLLYDVTGITSNLGNLSVAVSDWLDGAGDAFSTVRSDGAFILFRDGSDVYLNYLVPEPASAALLLLAAAALWRRR